MYFIPLPVDVTYLVSVYPAPGRYVMQHTRIGTLYLQDISRLQAAHRILGADHGQGAVVENV